MFDELRDAFEALIPRSEMSEGVADIIRSRPEAVDSFEITVGFAIEAMLASGPQRSERVENIARNTDTLLAPSIDYQVEAGSITGSLENSSASYAPKLQDSYINSQSSDETDGRALRVAEARSTLDKLAA